MVADVKRFYREGAFRKWIKDIAGGSPAWPKGMEQRLPPQETTKEALLDRFHSHTVNCKSCAVALANLTKVGPTADTDTA